METLLERLVALNAKRAAEEAKREKDAEVAALRAQLARQIAPSLSFYAPKVFNLTTGSRALDPRNGSPSSTWPFYLESYAAIAALQAGFVDDALALVE